MGFVVAQIYWFNSVYGFAHAEETPERIFIHEHQRVQPYPTPDGVRFSMKKNFRHGRKGLLVRVKLEEGPRGLRADTWMYLDDFLKAQELRAHKKANRKTRSSSKKSHARRALKQEQQLLSDDRQSA